MNQTTPPPPVSLPAEVEAVRVHYLKTWPDFFAAIVDGNKRFEVRKNDRGFAVGDTLVLREYSLLNGYTGRESRWLIGYMLTGPQFGIEAGYSVLSLAAAMSAPTAREEVPKP